jgi:2-dehydropantoate 2-reductase
MSEARWLEQSMASAQEDGGGMGAKRRVVLVGAGGLGTVYGAALARSGADVQLLARRAHAEAIQRDGRVRVRQPRASFSVALRAQWRPELIEPADTVVLMTKSHDTVQALASLDHIAPDVQLAVSFQNGVEKDRLLAQWCGADRVIGAMSMVGGTLDGPGQASHTLLGTSYIGELPRGLTPRVRALAADLEAGGMPVQCSERIRAIEWSKLAHAGPSMTITALPRLPFHQALQDPGMADLYVRLLCEGAAVAAGDPDAVPLEDLPGMFPVRRLSTMQRSEAVEIVQGFGRRMEQAGSTNVIVSMLRDLQSGRRLELEAVHGFLVDEAERLGLDIPYNRTCLELLQALDPHASGAA